MEYVCVLSVNGSLISYQINKEGENKYSAILKNNLGSRGNNISEKFSLEKIKGEWKSQPWDKEVVPKLTHCIEANV